MAYLEAQEAAGNALAIPTKHHASISANLFNPRAAHRVDDFKHLIADALGLELASERVTLSKFGIVGNPTRDRSHIRHSGLGTDGAQARIFDQAAEIISPISVVYSVGRTDSVTLGRRVAEGCSSGIKNSMFVWLHLSGSRALLVERSFGGCLLKHLQPTVLRRR